MVKRFGKQFYGGDFESEQRCQIENKSGRKFKCYDEDLDGMSSLQEYSVDNIGEPTNINCFDRLFDMDTTNSSAAMNEIRHWHGGLTLKENSNRGGGESKYGEASTPSGQNEGSEQVNDGGRENESQTPNKGGNQDTKEVEDESQTPNKDDDEASLYSLSEWDEYDEETAQRRLDYLDDLRDKGTKFQHLKNSNFVGASLVRRLKEKKHQFSCGMGICCCMFR